MGSRRFGRQLAKRRVGNLYLVTGILRLKRLYHLCPAIPPGLILAFQHVEEVDSLWAFILGWGRLLGRLRGFFRLRRRYRYSATGCRYRNRASHQSAT